MNFLKKNHEHEKNNKYSVSKTIYITFLALLFCVTINAQKDYKKSLDGIEWVKIESKANVTIKTHSGNELLIKAKYSHKTSDRAKGLRLVGEAGTDNTDVGFYVIKEGNNLIVRNLRKTRSAEIYLPETQNISVKSTWNGSIKIYGFKGEVEANAQLNGSIKVSEISGPLTANALNGSIEVIFSKVSQNSPITIYTTNGPLDITLPQDTPANISLYSTNGDIYTNFDLRVPEKNGLKSYSSKKVGGIINKGGVKIQLKSTNGNVYLRKK